VKRIICLVCGRGFRSTTGLSSHHRLAHASEAVEDTGEPSGHKVDDLSALQESIEALRSEIASLRKQLRNTRANTPGVDGDVLDRLAEVERELEDWRSGRIALPFDPEAHARDQRSTERLEAYVHSRIQELGTDEVRELAVRQGLWPRSDAEANNHE
jgi:chromosome segregation ATPase